MVGTKVSLLMTASAGQERTAGVGVGVAKVSKAARVQWQSWQRRGELETGCLGGCTEHNYDVAVVRCKCRIVRMYCAYAYWHVFLSEKC
ncbi:hypothetical protein PVAP13_5NG474300 [Panicum virgatum]|uniref:Uncharacterized protein n=1 Tax=Panicum virgatum TaxID=38727 RepID=A0A8T0S2Q1_PANVG|nr:hypothetical protein PVAP13_5NG474300 [Panicum virgatum]